MFEIPKVQKASLHKLATLENKIKTTKATCPILIFVSLSSLITLFLTLSSQKFLIPNPNFFPASLILSGYSILLCGYSIKQMKSPLLVHLNFCLPNLQFNVQTLTLYNGYTYIIPSSRPFIISMFDRLKRGQRAHTYRPTHKGRFKPFLHNPIYGGQNRKKTGSSVKNLKNVIDFTNYYYY